LLWYGVVGGRAILTFFLACIIIAGVYGAVTVSRRILLVQAVPAAVALVLTWLAQ
jgi:putative membrane protein